MKLLFDQNLSLCLVSRLVGLFDGCAHVHTLGLDRVADVEVWNYARDNDFIVVSKDADFSELSLFYGYPPKLIWLRIGNRTTVQIESLLRSNSEAIEALSHDPMASVLSLF